jgi:hypothetical protein
MVKTKDSEGNYDTNNILVYLFWDISDNSSTDSIKGKPISKNGKGY